MDECNDGRIETHVELPVEVVKEMKSKPFTLILILGLYAGGTYLWNQQAGFASEQEVRQVSMQVAGVQRTGLENRLGAIEAELFTLQQKVSELNAAHKPIDPLNYDRINQLLIEKAKVERELANFK